CATEDPLLW
nr:immunoglobulin heavy chain junction region [Macaca mulatta]MOW47151.1 immunoglobulin heavy chain junction region [Macaca mulatta]MOW47196.1 immunoglobulin heavy chain junction region [Macaca mulatta]MOW47375.1 immunoglobulin heavy chain junction region [Macaca mulatta]MOW48203.1 immunoglobulin heavy chain junction region [Macaca mulatta]